MITIKPFTFANVVKGTAKMILPLTSKKEKLQKKIIELAAEIEEVDTDIATYQDKVMAISGGLTTEQLVMRKTDLEGKYIPGFDINPEYVTFDEEKRVYVIKEATAEVVEEVMEEMPASL